MKPYLCYPLVPLQRHEGKLHKFSHHIKKKCMKCILKEECFGYTIHFLKQKGFLYSES